MTNLELAKYMQHKLFADRETVKEAWDYAFETMGRLPHRDQPAAITALMVLMNTISKQIIENEKKAN